MKLNTFLFSVSFVACMLAVQAVNASILVTDDFSYADGNLTSSVNWTAHSGAGAMPVQVAGGEVILAQGAGSREDVNRGLGAVMGAGSIFRYEFDVTVTGTTAATNVYFAHFKDATTGFNARAFVAVPVAGGDFTFGIGEGSTLDTTFASDFSFGTRYRLFAEYNYNTGLSSMWINDPSTIISSTTADIGQPMEAFALRQAGGNTGMIIDNLVVSVVPEPGTLAVLGFAAIAGLAVRRRRPTGIEVN